MLRVSEKKLLNRTQVDRIERACEKHNDVERLIRDLRAVRSMRDKNREKANQVIRNKKAGNIAINTRYRDKQAVFDRVVKALEMRLEKLRDAADAECPVKRYSARTNKAINLLERALVEVEGDVKSLRESHSVNGVLENNYGVREEVARLEGLSKEIRALLKK